MRFAGAGLRARTTTAIARRCVIADHCGANLQLRCKAVRIFSNSSEAPIPVRKETPLKVGMS